jgi:hypothetical protein
MFAPAANASHASHGTLPEVVIEDLQLGEGIEALPFSTVAVITLALWPTVLSSTPA